MEKRDELKKIVRNLDMETVECKWCGTETYFVKEKECHKCRDLRAKVELVAKMVHRLNLLPGV
jgi:hypothetical protein